MTYLVGVSLIHDEEFYVHYKTEPWICTCVFSRTLSLLVNGHHTQEDSILKSLKQGVYDLFPLSSCNKRFQSKTLVDLREYFKEF